MEKNYLLNMHKVLQIQTKPSNISMFIKWKKIY